MITIAITKSGDIVSIHTAKRGKSDSLFCPCCKTPVTAKQGLMNAWHFAHVQKECKYSRLGGESELHLAAKHLIAKRGEILLPKERVKVLKSVVAPDGNTYRKCESVIDWVLCKSDSISMEIRKNGYIPDLEMSIKGKALLVEFANTHKVDNKKIEMVRRDNLPCIEIDISKCSIDNLENYLFNPNGYNFKWLNNDKVNSSQQIVAIENVQWSRYWKVKYAGDYTFSYNPIDDENGEMITFLHRKNADGQGVAYQNKGMKDNSTYAFAWRAFLAQDIEIAQKLAASLKNSIVIDKADLQELLNAIAEAKALY